MQVWTFDDGCGVPLRILELFLRGALFWFKSLAYVGSVLVPGGVLGFGGGILITR